jgi:hypothetical protein
MLRRVALVKADVSEKRSVSIIRVTIIGELGTVLSISSIRNTQRHGVTSLKKAFFIVTAL